MFQPPSENRLDFLRRRPALWFSAGLGGLLLVLFADPLLVSKTFARRDMVAFFLPIEKAVHDSWRQGKVPLLMPEISFGRPLAANPNTGAFYPPRIAMAALPFRFAFKFFPVLHLWIGGVGVFLLARLLGISSGASAVSGALFSLSGPALSELMFPDFLPGLALLPWVVWAAGNFRRTGSRRSAALLGALFGVDLLVGDVFTAALAFFGGLLLFVQESPGSGKGKKTAVLGLLAASVPAILLASIQIVPALLYLPYTVRALGRFPLRVALTWSVSAWRLLELLVPLPFGNAAGGAGVWGEGLWSGKSTGFFQTLYPGVLASAAVLFVRPERGKRLIVYGLMGTSLALAAAGFYCPESLLSRASPIPLRYPEKLMAGFELGCALLAGFAFDSLRRGRSSSIVAGSLAVALALVACSLAIHRYPHATARFIDARWSPWQRSGAKGADRLPPILARGALPWVLLSGCSFAVLRRKNAWTLAALCCVALADVEIVRREFTKTESDSEVFSKPASVDAILRLDRRQAFGFLPFGDYALHSETRPRLKAVRDDLSSDFAAFFGIVYTFNLDYDISDLYRVDLARREIYRDDGRSPGLANFLAAYSARTTLVEAGRMPNGFSQPAGIVAGENWALVNPIAMPTFRFAPRVEEVANIQDAYARIHDDRVDLSAVTVVETGSRRETSFSGGTVRVLRNDPDTLSVRTEAPGPARIVVPRAPFPFRKVTVDGASAEAEPTNLCLSSVAVPAGNHEITIRETLPGGAAGPAISLTGAVILAALCVEPKKK